MIAVIWDALLEGRPIEGDAKSGRMSMKGAVWSAMLVPIEGNQIKNRSTTSMRIATFSLGFFFLVITAAYTANLTTFLVSAASSDILDVADAIRRDKTFCVEDSSAHASYMQGRVDDARSFIHSVQTDSSPYNEEVIRALPKCDIAITTASSWEINSRRKEFCEYENVGLPEYFTAGFAIRDSKAKCTSMLRDAIDYHMHSMKQVGWNEKSSRFDTLWNEFLAETDPEEEEICERQSDDLVFKKLNMSNPEEGLKAVDTRGILVFHAALMFVALFIAIVRWLSWKKTVTEEERKNAVTDLTNTEDGNEETLRGICTADEAA